MADHYSTIDHIAKELRARDFHNGDKVEDDSAYRDAAEKKINKMTNVELLELMFSELERQA